MIVRQEKFPARDFAHAGADGEWENVLAQDVSIPVEGDKVEIADIPGQIVNLVLNLKNKLETNIL